MRKLQRLEDSINSLQCTIPNNFLFKPFAGISFEDSQSGTFQDMEVQRARIVISALPGEQSTIGAYHQEISLSSSFNRLTSSCECA